MNKIKIAKEIAEVQAYLAENEATLAELKKIDREQIGSVCVTWGKEKPVTRGGVTEHVGKNETRVKFEQGIGADTVIDYLISTTEKRIEDAYSQLDTLAEKLKNAPR